MISDMHRLATTANAPMLAQRPKSLARRWLRLCAMTPLVFGSAIALACDGPHAVGTLQTTLVDSERNRNVPVRVHYPAVQNGSNTAAVTGCGFPAFAFGHGFTIAHTSYGYLADALAAAGIVVVLPGTEEGFSPNHARFGADLRFAASAVRDLDSLRQAVGPVRAIGGHSMGGGAAILGGAGLDGYLGLAPANTNPSAIAAAPSVSAPALMILGARDCVTPRAQHADPIFAALATPTADKRIVEIAGGSHCQFSVGSLTCGIGEQSCGGSATIPPDAQQSATLAEAIPFLRSLRAPEQVFASGYE